MAKAKYELATLSKANKDLALLIDEDLQKESALLQKLIKEVYDAHQKVKESHILRVQETQDKLKILNSEIDLLNQDIDAKSHTITIEQFNTLILAKDQIYAALSEMRLFDHDYLLNHRLSTHLNLFQTTIKNRLDTITANAQNVSELYYQPIIVALNAWLDTTVKDSYANQNSQFTNETEFNEWVINYQDRMKSMNTLFNDLSKKLSETLKQRTHIFYTENDDDRLGEKMEQIYLSSVEKTNKKIEIATNAFNIKYNTLQNQLTSIEEDTISNLKQKYSKRLDNEMTTQNTLQDDLKRLRFDIMHAEKKADDKLLNSLLKSYAKLEKQNLTLYDEKVKILAQKDTKKQRLRLKSQQKQLELKHEEELLKLRFQLEIERMKFSESRSLFKMREDQKSLENDKKVNQELQNQIKVFYQNIVVIKNTLLSFSESINQLYIQQAKTLMTIKNSRLEALKPLNISMKMLQLTLSKTLKMNSFKQEIFKVYLDNEMEKTVLNISHQEVLQKQLRLLTTEQKQVEVETLRSQEDAKNELVYQHALLEIAEKEHELQLMKIKSLYDSEIDLTKNQAERLNIGIGVNESMVKTTVESQILFAEQQIKFAEKEFEARLENIDRTRQQELSYITHKLAKSKHKYLFEENTLTEERDKKFVDLAYRLALFTDMKDHLVLKEQEERIKAFYEEKINVIREQMAQDPEIIRTNAQIDSIEQRSDKAINDAEILKNKTVEIFKTLLAQSMEKLDAFTSKQEKTLIPYIETEAASTAQKRLDEALEEAKQELNSKIDEPKKRIEELNNVFRELSQRDDLKEKFLLENISNLMQLHTDALHTLEEKKNALLKTIEVKRDNFIKELTNRQVILDKKNLDNHCQKQETAIANQLQHAKDSFEQKLNHTKQKNEHEHTSNINYVSDKIKYINGQLEQTIKAYKRYLRTPWFSQSERQKTLKRDFKEQLKSKKISIDQKY